MRGFNKNLKRLCALILMLAVAFGALAVDSGAAGDDSNIVRVGLYYGSSVLVSANLENAVGSGYEFGYFDSSRNFVPVGYTDRTKLTMVKDTNIYVCGSLCYDSVPSTSYVTLGCFHIQSGESFESFEQAAAKAAQFEGGFPAYSGGSYVARFGNYTSRAEAEAAMVERGFANCTVVTGSSSCVTVIVTGTNTILFEFDMSGSLQLAVRPISVNGEKTKTWFKGFRYYGAFEYSRRTGNNLTVVNCLPMADYLNGVISHEMSASWPLEALKAQCVCARTYASRTRHSTYGFDVCNTTCCQVYYGVYDSANAASIDAAVAGTAGKCIYYNDRLIDAVYHASCGGATEDAVNIWGSETAYLKGVKCDFEPHDSSWSYTYTEAQLIALLNSHNCAITSIKDISVVYTDMGNVYSVTFTDDSGKTFTYSRAAVRTVLETDSHRFTISSGASSGTTVYINNSSYSAASGNLYVINSSGTVAALRDTGSFYGISSTGVSRVGSAESSGSSDKIVISGTGWGHNVGMSQWGAYGMAEMGCDYLDILNYFYTGVDIR